MSGTLTSVEDLNKAISLAYASALDTARWFDFLEQLSAMSGGVKTHLVGYDFRGNINVGAAYANYDPDYIQSFKDYYCTINPWIARYENTNAFYPASAESYLPREKLERTEFYNDWVRPQEDAGAGGGALLFRDEGRLFLLGGQLPFKDQDALLGNYLSHLHRLAPHVRNALEIARSIHIAKLEALLAEQAIEAATTALLLLSASGRVLVPNPAARDLLSDGQILRQDLSGRFHFTDPQADAVFKAIWDEHRSGERSLPPAFAVPGEDGRPLYQCRVAAFLDDSLAFNPLPDAWGTEEEALLLTMTKAN